MVRVSRDAPSEKRMKMTRIGRKIRLYRLLMVLVVIFPTAVLFAQPPNPQPRNPQPRTHYLTAVPLPPAAKVAAMEQPVAGIAALPKRKMTLAEVGNMATYNHPGVQQARRQAEALRGTWVQAGLKPNPSVGYSAEDMTSGHAGTQGVTFSQPITPRHKLDARQAAINREYQAALQTYQIQHQKAINDAMLTAYRIAFNYRKCLILEELSQLSQEALRAGGALLQAGEIGRAAFLDIKIQSDRTQIALRDAKIAYQTACEELAILLTLPEEGLIEITDPVDLFSPELNGVISLAEIQAISPELRQAYSEVEAVKARLKQECAEAGIDFDTNARIAYNTETKQSEFSAGVAIPLRIFNRNQGNIQRVRSELAASYRNVERLERLIAQKYKKQRGEYQIARNRAISYKEILSETHESLRLALDAYSRGESGSLELLEANRTFSTVQIEYLDSLNAMMEAHVLLQGAMLSGGLEKPEF
jgi:cobalt-zinc-cadmium efflux system outer membrane protein